MSVLDIFTISLLQRPRGISQNVSRLYYVRRGASYKIHMRAKLYYLGRGIVFSSVATDFGPSTISCLIPLGVKTAICQTSKTLKTIVNYFRNGLSPTNVEIYTKITHLILW